WACGTDGGAVCCGPVWRCGEPDVPDRGPGALAVGRGFGVPGARGGAGEEPGRPQLAGRDRGGAGWGREWRAGGGGAAGRRGWGGAAGRGWLGLWLRVGT